MSLLLLYQLNNLVQAYNVSGAQGAGTISVTVPSGGIPSGALIVVGAGQNITTGGSSGYGSISDGTNTYLLVSGASLGNTYGAMFYAANANAVSGSSKITFTPPAGSTPKTAMQVLFATGIISVSPLDATGAASASNAPVSVTSTTPANSGDFFVGVNFVYNGGSGPATYMQDSNWTSVFAAQTAATTSNENVAANGGILNNVQATGKTFNPDNSEILGGVSVIASFKTYFGTTTQFVSGMGFAATFAKPNSQFKSLLSAKTVVQAKDLTNGSASTSISARTSTIVKATVQGIYAGATSAYGSVMAKLSSSYKASAAVHGRNFSAVFGRITPNLNVHVLGQTFSAAYGRLQAYAVVNLSGRTMAAVRTVSAYNSAFYLFGRSLLTAVSRASYAMSAALNSQALSAAQARVITSAQVGVMGIAYAAVKDSLRISANLSVRGTSKLSATAQSAYKASSALLATATISAQERISATYKSSITAIDNIAVFGLAVGSHGHQLVARSLVSLQAAPTNISAALSVAASGFIAVRARLNPVSVHNIFARASVAVMGLIQPRAAVGISAETKIQTIVEAQPAFYAFQRAVTQAVVRARGLFGSTAELSASANAAVQTAAQNSAAAFLRGTQRASVTAQAALRRNFFLSAVSNIAVTARISLPQATSSVYGYAAAAVFGILGKRFSSIIYNPRYSFRPVTVSGTSIPIYTFTAYPLRPRT